MKIGVIGLGRMGEYMSRRLRNNNHEVWGYRRNVEAAKKLFEDDALDGYANDIEALVSSVHDTTDSKSVFLMVIPAGSVDDTLSELLLHVRPGDIIIDHGNSNFKHSRDRGIRLADQNIGYIDCGTSGGVWGLDRGYCLMIGGTDEDVTYCRPIFDALSPDIASIDRTQPDSTVTPAENGWLHCGPWGAGHFVKMVHNGVEYGIMQSYAEGFNILKSANKGKEYVGIDAETAPMEDPQNYQYDLDIAEVAELWRRGSVVGSWLLDLTAAALRDSPGLDTYSGRVSDSGEGRWTINSAVDLGVPVPALSAALFARFNSQGSSPFADKILSAMRFMFGGHHEKK
ncbi:MAG: 6-phosphogluconate dehydrogenase (decarboxylating) [Euryarchaeota archaeon]|nr:6-phosphogluconate dehydrogenase (decarboxylating) [Euryarchaeota archaeon]